MRNSYMHISDLQPHDTGAIEQAAHALVIGFREQAPDAQPDLIEARSEVQQALEADKVCRVAHDADGTVLGWIGGQHAYARVWELHPLVVIPAAQRRGIGRTLVADLEVQVRQRGGLTILLGSDDETDMTTLSRVELYPDVWPHVASIRNLRGHPFEFYQKRGFVAVSLAIRLPGSRIRSWLFSPAHRTSRWSLAPIFCLRSSRRSLIRRCQKPKLYSV
jgi:aminoglycoside 6'-N-acetyltransferase I